LSFILNPEHYVVKGIVFVNTRYQYCCDGTHANWSQFFNNGVIWKIFEL